MAIAKVCSEDYYKELKQFVIECFEERNIIDLTTSWDYLLFKAMYNNVSDGQEWYSALTIRNWLKSEMIELGGKKEEELEIPSVRWIGKKLSNIPLFRKRRVGAGVQYLIDSDSVKRIMQSKGFPLPEEPEPEQNECGIVEKETETVITKKDVIEFLKENGFIDLDDWVGATDQVKIILDELVKSGEVIEEKEGLYKLGKPKVME